MPGQEGEPHLLAVDHFAEEHRKWREELARVGGQSPLLHFEDSPRTRLELSTTHPGGLPQFITGQKILLSSLIRDDLALRNARLAAGEITDKALEMRSVRGLETTHLGIGLTKWRFEGEDFTAPVLMRPLAMRRYGRDFELKLKSSPFFNPALARILQHQFGMHIDVDSFVALSLESGVFKPQPVIDRLRAMTSHIADFVVQPRLIVSSFKEVSHGMLADARNLDHPVLNAVAGSEYARRQIAESFEPVPVVSPNDRSPETDRLLLDTDSEQDEVISQIEAGHSIVVQTLPGTGGTQTVVNAAGALIARNRRVLIVSSRRATLDGISHRLSRTGLRGLAMSPRTLRRNLVESINRNESVESPQMGDIDDALARLRRVILDYQGALERVEPSLGVSPIQAVRELTRLAMSDDPPSTTARLDSVALESLSTGRDDIARDLVEAATLGQFQYGPDDSPWYGVTFTATEDAKRAHRTAQVLHENELPRLMSLARTLIEQTSMRPFQTLAELGTYLRLLMGIRETLDRFTPEVYDRSLSELIAAHATRGGADEMLPANRRRLRRLAREYVRPGVNITDMLERLRHIQQQRVLWQRYTSIAGTRPEVPVGISDVLVSYQSVYENCAHLDEVLGNVGTDRALKDQSIEDLSRSISGLADESEVLQNIQERTTLLERLNRAHMAPLLEDLSARHVPVDKVATELEQAWWQSALERMLQTDKALLSANTTVLDRLEADFKLVDDAHASANGQIMSAQRAAAWKIALIDYPQEAHSLRALLKADRATPEHLIRSAPHLMDLLGPIWLMSPYEVSTLPEELKFDAVLLVDAGANTFVETVGAIRRARQVVAFGDPITQTPSAFKIAVTSPGEGGEPAVDQAVDELHAQSALSVLSELLPGYKLTRSYRAGGEDLSELVNSRFYGGQIISLPWAGSFLGHNSLTYDFVRGGHGLPDAVTGAVESTDAEVERVVALVLEHATQYPRESLMVVTASARHAVRVHQAVLSAFSGRSELADFLLGDRSEPFAVMTLEQASAQSRDRVIFSVGYGRTPHGRVLSNFGSLTRPGGERLLAVAMTRARRALTIVSCFHPDDLDQSRRLYGVAALAEVLAAASPSEDSPSLPGEKDPMLVDLADRLRALGLTVVLDYRANLPLVASYGGKAIAVEIDFPLVNSSLREALRLRPAVLRRLGWHYLRVHSFDLFSDPDSVALRIANVVGYHSSSSPAAKPAVEAASRSAG
ncbi:AAA family ATPase [Lysinibacter sp. HNR]|nr:AAA family ATPase [Lysinibacter sp. HNR]WGD38593.1 AAA family ATPase [Lysinibacter sp. HNR]